MRNQSPYIYQPDYTSGWMYGMYCRKVPNQDVTMEEGAMCGKLSSKKKGFDSKKLAKDIAGEISGEYDIRRAWQGVDPSTDEKLPTRERFFTGKMSVAVLPPIRKIAPWFDEPGMGVQFELNKSIMGMFLEY